MTDTAPAPATAAAPAPPLPWWAIVVLGLLSIVAGILAVAWPGPTLLLVGLTFGIFLIVSGLGDLAGGSGLGGALRVLQLTLGVLSVAAGIVLVIHPAKSVLTAAWVLGLWFVLSGVLQLVQGVIAEEQRVYNIIFGLIGMVAGVIVLAKPGVAIATLVLIVGIGFIVRGVVTIGLGLTVRRLAETG